MQATNTMRYQTWFQNPKLRRQALVILSGGLILAAWAAGSLLPGTPGLRNGLMIAAALVTGWDIGLRAWASLRSRYASIELLVTIAAAGALVIGEYWEAAAVTFLFTLGAYLEARTLNRTRQVLQEMLDLAPTTAIVLRDGRQVETLPHEVTPGEVVLVKPGAKVPVDGDVIEGRSSVDESSITGEPMPEEKAAGDTVYAGTLNQNGLLHVRVTGAGADTTLARIIRRVEEAQEAKAPTQRFIERFARWYTPAIIGLSAAALLISRDIELALTLLVIGCPGALVLSTPVSVVAGIGRAAKSGILIKGGEFLENSGKISALALDKTGTLTQGKPRLTDIVALRAPALQATALQATALQAAVPAGAAGEYALPATPGDWAETEMEVLRWAAIAEAGSEHPLARAILAESEARLGDKIPPATDFIPHTGKGVQASYQGREIAAGTPDFMQSLGIEVGPDASEHLKRLQTGGKTAVLVALDGMLVGVLGIADQARETAPAMIRRLEQSGVKRIVMLTGDDRETAMAIAAETGVSEVYAGLLPEGKLDIIHKLQREGHVVAMIGDGINDAPALAAADIGIAMGAAGADIAIETADIALMSDDLMKVPEAIRLSKAALRNIRQNTFIALATVAGLLLGVLLGEVHMAGGMLIHEASVLVVILNGMRLLRA